MKKSKEEIKDWLEYRKSLLEQKSKSDDDFEKYITFIASGALGLTLTFLDKITPLDYAVYIWLVATGWVLLVLTLLINLFSHFLSSKYTTKSINEIDDAIDYDSLRKKLDKRNKIINNLNGSSIFLLIAGVMSILIYVILNLIQ
jgi:hypothetical protein